MKEELHRYSLIVGENAINKLNKSHVAIFGVGGVGGAAVIALARAGIGEISVFDFDVVEKSNINRQVVANQLTIGESKVEVIRNLIKEINPVIKVNVHNMFVNADNYLNINWDEFDFVIDALDNVSAKLLIIKQCSENNVRVISAMGAGNRLDPSKLKICDIFKTSHDPLAKVMRYELRKLGIKSLPVAFSKEVGAVFEKGHQNVVGSSPFVPNAMGLLLASYVASELIKGL